MCSFYKKQQPSFTKLNKFQLYVRLLNILANVLMLPAISEEHSIFMVKYEHILPWSQKQNKISYISDFLPKAKLH